MTDDEIVALGSFCEPLGHSAWAVVVEQFEQHCFHHIMTTKPHEQKSEGIYKTNYCSHRLAPQAADLDD